MRKVNNELPEGWVWTTLGEIIKPSTEKINPPNINEMPYVGLEHIEKHTGKLLDYGSSKNVRSTKTRFSKGDLLYGKLRPYLNKVYVADFDGICSTDILVFSKSSFASNKYLLYRFLSGDFVRFANQNVSGVQHPRVDFKKLSNFPISLPPLNAQKLIIAEIEKQFSRLDEAVAALKRIKANLKRYKASVLKDAVDGTLTEEWRNQHTDVEPASELLKRILAERRKKWEEDHPKKKYKEPTSPEFEDLPGLPKGWSWTNIDQILTVLTDYHANGSYQILKSHVTILNGDNFAIYVRATNLEQNNFDGNLKFVSEDAYNFLSKSKVFGNELIIGKIGNAGKVYYMPRLERPCTLGMNLFMLRFNHELLSKYIFYHLKSFFSEQEIKGKVKGVGNPSIDKEAIRSLTIALPPCKEQKEILEGIDVQLSKTKYTEIEIDRQLIRAERLRQSILKKAFSGRLVPQEANYKLAGD